MPGRIGILGGTFDPFHLGHLALARAARTALRLDEVRIVPSNVPPHRAAPGASSYHRFAMAALGIAGEPGLVLDDIEMALDGPSFTTTTLARLHDKGFTPSQIFFIVGADAFAEIATWRDYPQVLDAANFVVIARPGLTASSLAERLPELNSRMSSHLAPPTHPAHPAHLAHLAHPAILLMDLETPDVAGTRIRQRASSGASLDGMVPPLVAAHITAHHLYESSESRSASGRSAAHELHEQESI
jgi:nicotinate-nucleotide adenylyltransferase